MAKAEGARFTLSNTLCLLILRSSGMKNEKKQQLIDAMAAYDSSGSGGKAIYENYLSHDEITKGIAHGTIKKGAFSVSC